MDFSGLLVLAALWFLVSLLGKVGQSKKPQNGSRAAPRPGGAQPPVRRPAALAGSLDPTQEEGTRLEMVLREFGRVLEEVESGGRPRMPPPEEEEEWEDRESLEAEPEVVSLETTVSRTARPDYTQDDEAEQIVARRINAAASRDQAASKSGHAKFDQRIRQEPADKTATHRYTVQQLRDAVVWREILGPPVSLREEERGENYSNRSV